MKITVQQLKRAVPETNSARAEEFVAVFNEWSERFGITTKLRLVHFLAQCWHESGALRYVEENLNYSTDGLLKTFGSKYFPTRAIAEQYARQPQKIANRVYANRMGNGNEASGDGFRYKGRGLIQLTGKYMYQAYQSSGYCNGDLMNHTEWLLKAPGHTKSAMWYWKKNGCNEIADRDNGINDNEVCKAITLKVNGGLNHLSERQFYMRRFKKEFGI